MAKTAKAKATTARKKAKAKAKPKPLTARVRAREALASKPALKRPDMGTLTPAQFSFQFLHQRSWDATSFFEAAEAGMYGLSWQNGAESFKLRDGSLLEEGTTLHADFDVAKRIVALYVGAKVLSARSLAMQNAIALMARENKWKVREVAELRVYTHSENKFQDAKRQRVWKEFVKPKVALLPDGVTVNQLS